jgi:3-oxoacyl-[acyl-carrier protein] reductase
MVVPISSPINLTGKVAVVTGGARGIGQTICWSLAREGATIAVCDILNATETMEGLKKFGQSAIAHYVDMRLKEDVEKAIHHVINKFGRIDILVANAGILGKRTVEEIDVEEWDRVIEVNLRGTFLPCQQVWPIMKKQGGGKIVCLGSSAGKTGGFLAGPHYAASKGGVHTLVKWMARNGAPFGILVNGIAPGAIATPMTAGEPYRDDMIPIGRLGRPEDIAEVAVFLASQASNFITGVVLDVNGGLYMSLE